MLDKKTLEKRRRVELRRATIVLDVAKCDPEIDGKDGKVECFFCFASLSEKAEIFQHEPNCVWRRAKENEPYVRTWIEKVNHKEH